MAGACRVAIIMIIIAVKHAPTLPRSLPLSISAICYFTHTSNFHHKYANIHIPAYTELLFRQCLPLSVTPLFPIFVLLFRRFLFWSGWAKLLYFNYTRVGNTGCEARQTQTTKATATNVGNVNENGVKNQFHGFYAAVYCCKREPHIVGGALSLTHAHTATQHSRCVPLGSC